MNQDKSLPCNEVGEDLTAFLDGELPAERMAEVSEHVRSCAHCLRERRALGRTWDLLDYVEPIRPLDEWTRRFWARVSEVQTRERWRRRLVPLAAAALLLVGAIGLFGRGTTVDAPIDPHASDRQIIAVLDRIGRDDFEIGLRIPLLDNLHILENLDDRDLDAIREERFSDTEEVPDWTAGLFPDGESVLGALLLADSAVGPR